MCSTGTCGNPVQYSQPVQYRPPQAIQYTPPPMVNRPAAQYQAAQCKTNTFQAVQPMQYSAAPACIPTVYTQTQTTPSGISNRLGATTGTTTMTSKETGCCQVIVNNQNVAVPVDTQFVPNMAITPFQMGTAFRPNDTTQDVIMQASCVVSGAYFPDVSKIGDIPSGIKATSGRHKFMKVSLLTMLFGNLTFKSSNTGSNTVFTAFTVYVPVPGSMPLSLAGSVNGTVVNGDGSVASVVAVAADIPLNQATYRNHIGLSISAIPGSAALGPGQQVEVGFSFAYMSDLTQNN